MKRLPSALRGLRLTYPRVIAAMTAFVLLGGGYAIALSGTGTLQKENEIGVPTGSTPEVIRSVKGVGEVTAYDCDVSSPPTVTSIGFRNTSGETLRVWVDNADTSGPSQDPLTYTLADGVHNEMFGTGLEATGRVHVFPADGSKSPQAEIVFSHVPDDDSCDDVQVSVLNLTTQE